MNRAEASERLSKAGLRLTRQREVLLDLVLSSSGPFSVKLLHERAEAAGLRIHLATVHRNLAEFVEVGLVDELPGDDNRFYALHSADEASAHVYCIDCRMIRPLAGINLEQGEAQRVLAQALAQSGFDESSARLMLSAHCRTQQRASQTGAICTQDQGK